MAAINETQYAPFRHRIIRTSDFLPSIDSSSVLRGETCIQTTTQVAPSPSSNVCLHDGEPFVGDPVPLPVGNYDPIMQTFPVLFCFCSLSCAKRYAMSNRSVRPDRVLPVLAIMAANIYGVQSVIPAPPRELLSKFMDAPDCPDSEKKGYTIEEFRGLTGGQRPRFVELMQKPFHMGTLNMMSLDASFIVANRERPAREIKNPKKLFQMSPHTRKQIAEKKRLADVAVLPALNEGGQEHDPFNILPESVFSPQPLSVDHPLVNQTIMDLLRKSDSGNRQQ